AASSAAARVCRPLSGRHSASLARRTASRLICLSSGFDAVVGAVEGQRGRLAVDDRLQVRRPPPDELDVGQGVGRLVEPEVDARVLLPQEQLAAVAVVAVYYINPRLAEVRQAEEEPLLDFLELAGLNDVLAGLLLEGVGEHLLPGAKLRGQEGVDEGDV